MTTQQMEVATMIGMMISSGVLSFFMKMSFLQMMDRDMGHDMVHGIVLYRRMPSEDLIEEKTARKEHAISHTQR